MTGVIEIYRVRTGPRKPGKSWIFFGTLQDWKILEKDYRSWKVLESVS